MPFIVIPPPKDETELESEGKKILEAAFTLGRPVDVEGFLQAWIRGICVVAETDPKGRYVGIAFAVQGDRWLYVDKAVTVLYKKVIDRKGFVEFMRAIAIASGANRLIIEDDEPIEKDVAHEIWAVREYIL